MIICLTSNLGDVLVHSSFCDANSVIIEAAKAEVIVHTLEHFPLELLNCLDVILVFNKLSRIVLLDVIGLQLNNVTECLKDR